MVTDKFVYVMVKGKFKRTNLKLSDQAISRPNFVIVCNYGDWSGFRTLADCEKQFSELENYYTESNGKREYSVVER